MTFLPTPSRSLPKTLARVSKAAGQGSVVFFPDFGGNTLYARPLVAELGSQIDCLALRFEGDEAKGSRIRCWTTATRYSVPQWLGV